MLRDFLIALALVAAVLAIYGQTGNHEFLSYDDPNYVTTNLSIRDGVTLDSLWRAFTSTEFYNWHPLTRISYLVDYELYGLSPRGYHLTNVALHTANTLLVFVIFRRMTGKTWPAALVAALFGVHPLHVESVAWISERKDVLSACFWLLTIWAYVRYAERRSSGRYVTVLALFTLGLMAKPMVVTLPFVLLLLDYWPLGRWSLTFDGQAWQSLGRLISEKVPLLALAAAASAMTIYAQSAGGAVAALERFPLSVRVTNALVSYVAYLGHTLWPVGLSIRYPHPGVTLPVWKAGVAALILLVVTGLAVRALRSRPYVAVGWLWYLATLIPVIGVIQVGDQAMADRYTYIPLIGVFITVAWGLRDAAARPRIRTIVPWTAALALAALTAAAWNQTRYWRDSVTLYERAISVTESDPLPHYNLANELREQGRLDDAVRHYEAALRFDPNYAAAHVNLGPLLAQQGRTDEAIAHYVAALRLRPDAAEAHNNLGMLLGEQGKISEAIPHFEQAVRLKPELEGARRNLEVARKLVQAR
ncbi:MAG: tetratricopeptide repeat protein [Nitrospirota bacterium]